jgi:acylphosphatase
MSAMTQQGGEALRAVAHGRVQGVGFRAYVQKRGRELGLKGYARNLANGTSVEVVAEGSQATLEALLAAVRTGPSGAHVERVDSTWMAATGEYEGFGVR